MPGVHGNPLITQKTDLKSLKYTTTTSTGQTVGKDPYVTKKVPGHQFEKDSTGLISGRFDAAPTPEASSIIGSRADDLKRLSKVIKDKPGLKFGLNQAILGKSPKEIALIIGATLAQAPVNGTGTHFTHGFVQDTYLKKDMGQKTGLGRFIAEQLGVNSLLGSSRALTGKTIISDNEGEENYRPNVQSDLLELNSKFDLKPGGDDFSSTLLDKLRVNPYVDFLATNFSDVGRQGADLIGKAGGFVKGIFSKKKNNKIKNPLDKSKLGDIFKVKGDNLGQENFQPMTPTGLISDEEKEMHDSIQSDLKGLKDPVNHLSSGVGGDEIEGRPLIRGGEKRIVRENDGGRGFEPQAPDFLSKKESEQLINVNGKLKPLRPEYTLSSGSADRTNIAGLSDQTVKTVPGEYNELTAQKTAKEDAEQIAGTSEFAAGVNVQGPSTTGRIMPQIGPDGVAEGEFRTFVDEEGGVTGVIERQYDPNNPSQLKMYLQDQSIPESEDLKTELGGTVSSGNTNVERVTKLIDFRKIRKYGVNAGVKGKGESIGPDTNAYSSNTPTDILPDYTTQEVGVRLGYATKGVGDFINMSNVIEVGNTDAGAVAEDATWKYYKGDIIPFTFNTLTPDGQKFIFFRAFLDDMQDSFSGDWAGTQYVGRAEEFYTYQGFTREVSFNFKVAAFSKQELLPLYKKLNHLVAATAPTYSKAGNFMRGTLTTLSIGEYFDRQDGFISKVDLSWETGYPWEIDLFDENVPQVPTILNVSVSFTPIHNFEVKNDIDLENSNESYFGAQYGTQREPVETVNTTQPKPAIQPRPEAEVAKPPKPAEVKAAPEPPVTPPANAPAIETPIAQTGTVQPTTDIQAAGGVEEKKQGPFGPKVIRRRYKMLDYQESKDPNTGAPEFYYVYEYTEEGKPGVGEGDAFGPIPRDAQRQARANALADFNK